MTPLDWIDEACALLLDPAPSMGAIAAWLGAPGSDRADPLLVDDPPGFGVLNVVALARAGVPHSLSARYARGAGPLESEVSVALGPSRELPRGSRGPFQLAYPAREGGAAACFIAATTPDGPELPADERRVVEIVIRRDAR